MSTIESAIRNLQQARVRTPTDFGLRCPRAFEHVAHGVVRALSGKLGPTAWVRAHGRVLHVAFLGSGPGLAELQLLLEMALAAIAAGLGEPVFAVHLVDPEYAASAARDAVLDVCREAGVFSCGVVASVEFHGSVGDLVRSRNSSSGHLAAVVGLNCAFSFQGGDAPAQRAAHRADMAELQALCRRFGVFGAACSNFVTHGLPDVMTRYGFFDEGQGGQTIALAAAA